MEATNRMHREELEKRVQEKELALVLAYQASAQAARDVTYYRGMYLTHADLNKRLEAALDDMGCDEIPGMEELQFPLDWASPEKPKKFTE